MSPSPKRIGYAILIAVCSLIVVGSIWVWVYSKQVVSKDILLNSPCTAPCWQGIVPGAEMEVDQLVQILTWLDSARSISQYDTAGGTEIRWRWKQWPWKLSGYNSIYLTSQKVNNVSLSIEFVLTIEEIVNLYGEPEAVNWGPAGTPERPYTRMNLFYPTQGLQFVARLPLYSPVLEPSTRLIASVYFSPAESVTSWVDSTKISNLRTWPGYGELKP